jgi:uncharacterized protein YjbI with pentapeptide repeats
MKLPMTNEVRKQVAMAIKNKLDISDLIENYSIAGEDLSYAIINRFNRDRDNICGLNLTHAIIGTEATPASMNQIIAIGCNFKGTKFLGQVSLRKGNFNNTNWNDAYIPYCDYKFADLRGCSFCGTVFTMSTSLAHGAKFSPSFFEHMGKLFNLSITVLPEIKE